MVFLGGFSPSVLLGVGVALPGGASLGSLGTLSEVFGSVQAGSRADAGLTVSLSLAAGIDVGIA